MIIARLSFIEVGGAEHNTFEFSGSKKEVMDKIIHAFNNPANVIPELDTVPMPNKRTELDKKEIEKLSTELKRRAKIIQDIHEICYQYDDDLCRENVEDRGYEGD
jgi:hypothetical protein